MEVVVKSVTEPGWWLFRRTVGYNVIVNKDRIYDVKIERGRWRDSRLSLSLIRGNSLITQEEIEGKQFSWRMIADGTEIARIHHRYGVAAFAFFDVLTNGSTYKSFQNVTSLSKDKCFLSAKLFCTYDVSVWCLDGSPYSRFWFIDELDVDVAAMLALYLFFVR